VSAAGVIQQAAAAETCEPEADSDGEDGEVDF